MKVCMFTIQGKNDSVPEEVGFLSIAAYLRENGYDVSVFAIREDYNDIEIADEVIGIKPEVLLFSVYSDRIEVAKRMIRKFKGICQDAFIIAGGYAPTYYDEIFDEVPEIEVVVRGEGEVTTLELLECLKNGKSYKDLEGISFVDNGVLVKNPNRPFIPDLDMLPLFARDFLKKYNILMASVSTSRGCCHACSFCCSPSFWSQKGCRWRGRSIDSIITELKYLKNELNMTNIVFLDNSFEDPSLDRMEELLDRIISENLGISYWMQCRVTAVLEFPDRLMEKLVKSGVKSVFLGVESGNAEDLILYNKDITLEKIDEAIKKLYDYDISVEIGFINFNPYSTFEKLRKNLEFLYKYNYTTFLTNFKGLRVYRGCALYYRVKRDGLLKTENKNVFLEEYNFADERVGKLYEALQSFLEDEAAERMLGQVKYFSSQFKEEIFGEINEDNKEVINEILGTNAKILQEFSDINYHNFLKLLDIAEFGSDVSSFEEELKNLLVNGQKIIKKLSDNRLKYMYIIAKQKKK